MYLKVKCLYTHTKGCHIYIYLVITQSWQSLSVCYVVQVPHRCAQVWSGPGVPQYKGALSKNQY